jgi:AMMECR1 domain-containing protein
MVAAAAALLVTGAGPTLEPYRELARSPRAAALLAVARSAMERHWDDPAGPARPPADIPWPGAPAALYVSLVDGRRTRACVGRPTAAASTLSEAVAALAVEALQADPRHPPVRREELPRLRIVISFAGDGEAIPDPMLADPGREGFSISTPRGSVAFLPGEARTVAWALREARRAGLLEGGGAAAAGYRRFPVVAVSEPEAPSRGEPGELP